MDAKTKKHLMLSGAVLGIYAVAYYLLRDKKSEPAFVKPPAGALPPKAMVDQWSQARCLEATAKNNPDRLAFSNAIKSGQCTGVLCTYHSNEATRLRSQAKKMSEDLRKVSDPIMRTAMAGETKRLNREYEGHRASARFMCGQF